MIPSAVVLIKVAPRDMDDVAAHLERVGLAAMTPHGAPSSTKYCLAAPGSEYLVYLPEGGLVTLDLSDARGALAVEWIDRTTG